MLQQFDFVARMRAVDDAFRTDRIASTGETIVADELFRVSVTIGT